MAQLGKFFIVILLFNIACFSPITKNTYHDCYSGDGIAVFLSSFIPFNTSIELSLDDGEYEMHKYMLKGIHTDSLLCLTNYYSIKDTIKIHLKVGKKDSTMFLDQRNDHRVFIGVSLKREPIISTDFGFWDPRF